MIINVCGSPLCKARGTLYFKVCMCYFGSSSLILYNFSLTQIVDVFCSLLLSTKRCTLHCIGSERQLAKIVSLCLFVSLVSSFSALIFICSELVNISSSLFPLSKTKTLVDFSHCIFCFVFMFYYFYLFFLNILNHSHHNSDLCTLVYFKCYKALVGFSQSTFT